MTQTATMSFPMTRQGVRNLDAVNARNILPVSGAPLRHAAPGQNVGDSERWLSTAAGAALVVFGLARATKLSLIGSLVGGALLHRGLTGRCELYGMLGQTTAGPADPTVERVYTR